MLEVENEEMTLRSLQAIDELAARPQWVVWPINIRKEKPTKMPYNPATGETASVKDPATWADFDTAVATYRDSGFDGVGYVLTASDPYVGLDLDRCRDHQTGG